MAVLHHLLVQQPDRLRALLRDDRVFPDADLGMEDPAGVLVGADDLAAEVAHADEAVRILLTSAAACNAPSAAAGHW
jgi:hypothetical protein